MHRRSGEWPPRIVARGAKHFAGAFDETSRLAQAIGRTDDFEFVLAARRGCVIEVQNEILQGFTGAEGEWTVIVADYCAGEGKAGGFQMAGHADLHLAIGTEPRGIHDRLAHQILRAIRPAGEFHMPLAGAVTPFAIDTAGERAGIHWFFPRLLIPDRYLRVGVVAEHTVIGNRLAKAHVIRPVEAGIHGPVTALFGVPAQGQFDQCPRRGSM